MPRPCQRTYLESGLKLRPQTPPSLPSPPPSTSRRATCGRYRSSLGTKTCGSSTPMMTTGGIWPGRSLGSWRGISMSYPDKQNVAFVRLHALVRRGYEADLGTKDDTNLFALNTLAGRPPVHLVSSYAQTVISLGIDNERPLNTGEGDPDCIYADSGSDWQAFVSSVPALTTWEALKFTARKIKEWLVLHFILGVFTVGLVLLGVWAWRLVAGAITASGRIFSGSGRGPDASTWLPRSLRERTQSRSKPAYPTGIYSAGRDHRPGRHHVD